MAEIKRNYQPGKKASTTIKVAATKPQPLTSLFSKTNYQWMAIGAVIIALGMILMSGGKNDNPNEFNPSEVYSTTRITIAPILILLGLLVEVYAIFKNPKASNLVTE